MTTACAPANRPTPVRRRVARAAVAARVPAALRTLALGAAAAPTLVPAPAAAQVVASERGTVTQRVSGTDVTIDYSRPSLRGRSPVFGGLVPWGEVWTPGANDATTFRFSRDVTLQGERVPAGTYSVWLQPRETGAWTLALNEDATLFHLAHPPLDEALLTVDVTPEVGAAATETLTWEVAAVHAEGATLALRWGDTRVPVALGVDPGWRLTLAPDEATPYVGEWSVGGRGSVRIAYDDAERRLYAYVPQRARPGESDRPQYLLVPLGDGAFLAGYLINGELAFLDEGMRFAFQGVRDGRATRFEMTAGGRVQVRGERAG